MPAIWQEGIWEISDSRKKTTTNELPEAALWSNTWAKEIKQKNKKYSFGKLWQPLTKFPTEWMGEAAACSISFDFPSQCELVLPHVVHFKYDVGKGAKRNRVLLAIMRVFPVTLMRVGLGPLEQLFHTQTATWMRKMSVGYSSSVNETCFLTTQTQTWYFGDISVWPCVFMGWGWNPDSRQMTRGETSASPKSYFAVVHQFFSPLSC